MPDEAVEHAILREQEIAKAAVIQNRRKVNDMKTRCFNTNWLAALLGVSFAGGAVVAATAYVDIERRTHAEEAFGAKLDRLYADQELSAALKQIHEGKADAAAARMDVLLCDHILLTDSELASADARTRLTAQLAFQRIAQRRPKTGEGSSGSAAKGAGIDQAAAEEILTVALGPDRAAQAK